MAKKSLYDVSSEVDIQTLQLEKARAILSKLNEALEQDVKPDTTEAFLLIADIGRLNLLLGAADEIIFRVIPELKAISEDVFKSYKTQKREWEDLQQRVIRNLEDGDNGECNA